MRGPVAAAVLVGILAAGAPASAAGGWHGGHFPGHGGFPGHRGFPFHRPGASVFLGFGFSPFVVPYYYPYPYPYQYPYPYVVYPAPYPPPPGSVSGPPPSETPPPEGEPQAPAEDDARATYGLVQLRGVPDGADLDLDGRFWLRAQDLADRWLALPEGKHTLRVRLPDSTFRERRVDVAAGRQQVVRFDTASPPPA